MVIFMRALSYENKNFDIKEIKNQVSDPVESYFRCISFCNISDDHCISKCVEILRDSEN